MKPGNYDAVDEHGSVEVFSCTPLEACSMDGGIGFHVGSAWNDQSCSGYVAIDVMTIGQRGVRIVLREAKARAFAHLLLAAADDVESGIACMNEEGNQ